MVAYGFKIFFAPQIREGVKRQTVRGERRRHAEPGEPIKLYTGMRTRECRKIIPDPLCIARQNIVIEMHAADLRRIEIDGFSLNGDDIESFARQDGFAPEYLRTSNFGLDCVTARGNMAGFWSMTHPDKMLFEGQLIKWK